MKSAFQALKNVCVVACDAGRWGLDCVNVCDCRNGDGGCDAQTGRCQCEAGFTGPRCDHSESNTCTTTTLTQHLCTSNSRESTSNAKLMGLQECKKNDKL